VTSHADVVTCRRPRRRRDEENEEELEHIVPAEAEIKETTE